MVRPLYCWFNVHGPYIVLGQIKRTFWVYEPANLQGILILQGTIDCFTVVAQTIHAVRILHSTHGLHPRTKVQDSEPSQNTLRKFLSHLFQYSYLIFCYLWANHQLRSSPRLKREKERAWDEVFARGYYKTASNVVTCRPFLRLVIGREMKGNEMAKQTASTGKIRQAYPIATIMGKWKWLLVNSYECNSPVSTGTEI